MNGEGTLLFTLTKSSPHCKTSLLFFAQVDLPFTPDLLEDIPLLVMSPKFSQAGSSGCVCGSGGSSSNSSRATSTTTSVATNTASSGWKGSLTPVGAKSRIPRPISLPKRLEAKLGSPSPVRSSRGSSRPGTASGDLNSPTKQPLFPPSAVTNSSRKSRVRDTIRLFDAKSTPMIANSDASVVTGLPPPPVSRQKSGSATRKAKNGPGAVAQLKSPKTGAGESMALDSSSEQIIK